MAVSIDLLERGHLLPRASCARHLCFSSGFTLQFAWKEITAQIREVMKPQDHTVLDLGLVKGCLVATVQSSHLRWFLEKFLKFPFKEISYQLSVAEWVSYPFHRWTNQGPELALQVRFP